MAAHAGYEFVEHTADLGLRSWGPTLNDAFAENARALFTYMVDVDAVKPRDDTLIQADADTLDRLLFRFLDELLFQHQTELVAFSAFTVHVTRRDDGWHLEATARGEPLDEDRHGHVHEVKAITYHDMHVDPGPPAIAFVIVDI